MKYYLQPTNTQFNSIPTENATKALSNIVPDKAKASTFTPADAFTRVIGSTVSVKEKDSCDLRSITFFMKANSEKIALMERVHCSTSSPKPMTDQCFSKT